MYGGTHGIRFTCRINFGFRHRKFSDSSSSINLRVFSFIINNLIFQMRNFSGIIMFYNIEPYPFFEKYSQRSNSSQSMAQRFNLARSMLTKANSIIDRLDNQSNATGTQLNEPAASSREVSSPHETNTGVVATESTLSGLQSASGTNELNSVPLNNGSVNSVSSNLQEVTNNINPPRVRDPNWEDLSIHFKCEDLKQDDVIKVRKES